MLNYDELDIVRAVMLLEKDEQEISRTKVIDKMKSMLANENAALMLKESLQQGTFQSALNELQTMSDVEFASLEFSDDDDAEDME